MIISVEGNIGTGKSTLIRILKEKHGNKKNIIFVEEPLNEWLELKDKDGENILKKFYDNQERWSYSFQMNAFITRAKSILKANPSENIVIVERSVLTDRNVFASLLRDSNKISSLEWQLYEQWFSWLLNDYNIKPDLYIYLSATPQTSFTRMKNRARSEEDIIPMDYITSVAKKHDQWLFTETNSVTIDVNNDFENDPEFRKNVLKIVDNLIDTQLENLYMSFENS